MSDGERIARAHEQTHCQNGTSEYGRKKYFARFQKSPSLNSEWRFLNEQVENFKEVKNKELEVPYGKIMGMI